MEAKLVTAFKSFDTAGQGTIDKADLTEICKQLDPDAWTDDRVGSLFDSLDKGQSGFINYSELAIWVTSGVPDGKLFEAAALKMPGDRLADGDQTDAGLDKIRSYLNNALDIKPEHYATPKATTKLTWLREITNLVDPAQNPCGFRICQGAVLERGAVGPLLGLAQNALSDAVVIKSLELLARTAFSNTEAAVKVVCHEAFLPTIHMVLLKGEVPEKLTALQLAQAIGASSTAPKVHEMLPKLVAEVTPMLTSTFVVLARATFDVLVSISFGNPSAVLDALSWNTVASWLAVGREPGNAEWLDHDNLTQLACGYLAVNVLALPPSGSDSDYAPHFRQLTLEWLRTSNFLEFFVLAMEAAVTQREWPAHSGAYHSVSRLASMVSVLAGLGFRRELTRAVSPLASLVETSPDEATTRLGLLALRSLVDDFACLETFLPLGDFRSETLELLHKAGDEKEASDLLSYSTAAENALAAANATFEQSGLSSPPNVKILAELFNEHAPMDGELSKTQLFAILSRVPIGPAKDVEASLSGDKTCTFDFAAFAQRVYGSPTLLGWWPSLMEETHSMWSTPEFQELHPPRLTEVLSYYELGAKGMSGVTSDVILSEILPMWKKPVEGELVEDLFAEIRGETLKFKEFVSWMQQYFRAVEKQQKDTESPL